MFGSESHQNTSSRLELALITVSIVISFVLYALPVQASSKMYEKGRRPMLFSIMFIPTALSSVAIAITAIILGYQQKISLDAIAAVVFALIPGLVSFPRDAFTDLYVYFGVFFYRVFPILYHKFSYITMGHPCKSDVFSHSKAISTTQFQECRRQDCNAYLYIRYFKLGRFILFPNFAPRLFRYQSGNSVLSMLYNSKEEIRWDGAIIDHHKSLLVLRNSNPVPEQKWYLALSRSLWIVMQPWLLNLNRPPQVMQALRLLSDIISIGRLVLYYRGDYIKQELEKIDFYQDGLARRSAEVCEKIVNEIELTEWSPANALQISAFREGNLNHRRIGDAYSVVFFLLVVKSKLFGEWVEWKGGREESLFSLIPFSRRQYELESYSDNPASYYPHLSSVCVQTAEEDTCFASCTSSSSKRKNSDESVSSTGKRSRYISGVLQWVGLLLTARMPFYSTRNVAAFRHQIRAPKILANIEKAARQGQSREEMDSLIRGQVDEWLKVWGCDVHSSS